jgi:anti-anti-sigma factor
MADMNEAAQDSGVVVVRASGELDGFATHRLLDDVRSQVTPNTEVIVVSLADTTSVRWNALCTLVRAAQTWRARRFAFVLEAARPSVRAMLATVEGA